MPITATMLDTSDLVFDYLENFYDDDELEDFYDSKPRRKESKFLKYLITETIKKRKIEDEEEIDEEIFDETCTSTSSLLPLATKQLKRRKFSSQSYSYTYPTMPLLSIRNMRPKSSGISPIVSIPVLPIATKKKNYPVISERQQLNAIKAKKVEEDSEEEMKLDLEPAHSDTSFAERILECLRDLGGKATGAEISNWISDRYDDVATTKKKLGYTINAVLSSKKHANLFYKDTVIIDGNKRALWCLVDHDGRKKKEKTNVEDEEQIVDENSMDLFKELEEGEDGPLNILEEDNVVEEKKRSLSPRFHETPKPTITPEEKSEKLPATTDDSELFDNIPIVDILKSSLLDEEKSVGKVEVIQEPYRTSDSTMVIPIEDIKEEKKTPLSRRRKIGSMADMDAWIPAEKELKDGERKIEESSDLSPGSSDIDESAEEELKEGEPIDIVVEEKKKSKRKVGRPAGKKRSSKGGGEESFEDIEEEDEEDEDTGENEEKPKKKGRKLKRKNSVTASTVKKLNTEEEKGESETDTKYEEPDELEGSTYTEMIAHALRSLGGRGTGLEITTFIDENYSGILHNKTVTWRNSVMGCLSANRRNLFSKEPVKQYAKRYVWVLNEDKAHSKKKKSQNSSFENLMNTSLEENSIKEENVYPPTTDTLPAINNSNSNSVASSPNPSEIPEFDYEDFFDDIEPEEHEEREEEEQQQQREDEEEEEEEEENSVTPKKSKKMSKNAERCDNAVDLITEALKEMGGKATGVQITDWLAENYKQLGTDKKKLGYTVNAVLSSKKYKGKFVKDKMVQGGSRALWKLASSPKDKQRKN